MTLAYGLTPKGFVSKPLPVAKAEFDGDLTADNLLGKSATLPDGSLPLRTMAGQVSALFSDGLGAFWDLGQAIVASLDPNSATGKSQDDLCALTGVMREDATSSSSVVTCVGVPGTALPKGRGVQTTPSNALFNSLLDAAIALATPWTAGSTPYTKGLIRSNLGNVYYCITSGVGAVGGPGPSGTTLNITDGTAHWRWIGAGVGYVNVPFEASVTGPIAAPQYGLNTITTPVFGWNAAVNLADAVIGRDVEGPTALRIRRQEELHAQGDSAEDAIRNAVLGVTVTQNGNVVPVTSCSVFSNRSDATSDGATPAGIPAGMPPHSVLVLADYDGAPGSNADLEAAIGQKIWDVVGAGIATTFGEAAGAYAVTSTPTDSQGNLQTIYWARPTQVPVTVDATVKYDNTPGASPSPADITPMIAGGALSDGSNVPGVIPLFGTGYPSGKNVWGSALSGAIFRSPFSTVAGAQPIPGILDAVVQVKRGADPLGASVVIGPLERATFDSGDIAVHLTGVAP